MKTQPPPDAVGLLRTYIAARRRAVYVARFLAPDRRAVTLAPVKIGTPRAIVESAAVEAFAEAVREDTSAIARHAVALAVTRAAAFRDELIAVLQADAAVLAGETAAGLAGDPREDA